MIENDLYDLMEQTVIESKSLWRIENNYLSDSQECADCREFWEKMKADKEQHCQDLINLISAHLTTGEKMEQPIRR
jgi:hypothetical protein